MIPIQLNGVINIIAMSWQNVWPLNTKISAHFRFYYIYITYTNYRPFTVDAFKKIRRIK